MIPPRFEFAKGTALNIPLRELPVIKKQKRKKPALSSIPEWKVIGADTETKKGKCWLFSTEAGVWEIETFNDIMNMIYHERKHLSKWKKGTTNSRGKKRRGFSPKEFFFWNLKFDCQAVLRLLSDEVVLKLLASKDREGDIGRTKIIINADTGNFTPEIEGRMVELDYLEGKAFSIKPINWTIVTPTNTWYLGDCYWWDIAQFYGKMRLQTASELYLGDSKVEKLFDGSVLDASRFDDEEYTNLYREDIEKYAVKDAVLTGQLARLKRSQFIETGVRFIKPYSLANVAQRSCLDICDIPKIDSYNESPIYRKYLKYALTAYRGGWFECRGAGYFPGVDSIDLASAYPYVMYHLPDIMGKGIWLEGKGKKGFLNWLEQRKPLTLGFAEVSIQFEESQTWHPLVSKGSVGTLVTPRFVRGWFTAEEISEAIKWPHKSIVIGRWFHFSDQSGKRPYRPFIKKFYEMKYNSPKDSVEYVISKVMANSIYGKTCQATKGKSGNLWNPLYAATITGATRARIAEVIRLNGFTAVQVATDGVIFPKDEMKVIPERPLPAPYNLGKWEKEENGDLLVLMSGVYSIKNRKLGKTKTRFRGTATYFLNKVGSEGLFGFCDEYSDLNKIVRTVRKPYSVRQAKQKGDLSLTNVFAPQLFSITPQGDVNKRYWLDKPETFGDLKKKWWDSLPQLNVK